MHRTIIASALALVAASPVLAVDVERIQFRQDFGPVTSSRHSATAPTQDFFGLGFVHGPAAIDLVTGDDGVQNPLYEASTREGTNPLYNGDDRGDDPVSRIASISYELGPITTGLSARDNIVHRDVAARNILMTTDDGVFSSLDGAEFMFGVDAPAENYFGAGPVTWVTIDTITLYLDGDADSTEFYVFTGTWFTDTFVPAPGAAALFAIGALSANRRRR